MFLASPLALLATDGLADEEYPRVVAGRAIRFPRDAGAHTAFRSEWWYITGWVQDATGNTFGVQVTFFRNRPRVAESNPSAFAPRQLLFAHAAIADP
ncbi:MAG: carotenoid 1,2-hydratase, partial [Pseudomonadota bacterium]|nr:carotenoid 1,2-hydratase [Pseudomonadota bacterium]